MRWATFRLPDDPTTDRVGVVDGDAVHPLPAGPRLLDVLPDLAGAADDARRQPPVPLELVRLRAPIPHPPSVRDFYAFEQHVRTARERRGLEMVPEWFELPVFYFSNPHGVVGPDEEVAAPPSSRLLDYELEVAAVIGIEGADLSPEEAAGHIAGYTIMNDWSARDVQGREMKVGLGPAKGKDFATSLGPFLVTPDELPADLALRMTARVNGDNWSTGNLADAHWTFPQMVAHASSATRVVAGDVIGSGTCGTGCILELSLVHGTEAYPWLQPGDVVQLEVEGLGVLANRVVARGLV